VGGGGGVQKKLKSFYSCMLPTHETTDNDERIYDYEQKRLQRPYDAYWRLAINYGGALLGGARRTRD
jgi:hypothetical protein